MVESPPFRKAGFSPMSVNNGRKKGPWIKTTAHAQWNLNLKTCLSENAGFSLIFLNTG
jgi:hypothetical protein